MVPILVSEPPPSAGILKVMTPKQFFDWQTGGGTDDVMRLVDALERADLAWCAIGGIAVNHWAKEPMVTRDFDFVVAAESNEGAVAALEQAGFGLERFPHSISFRGRSTVGLQLSTDELYRHFPAHAVPADVHGVLLRVASLADTVAGKVAAWSDPGRRPSKRLKDLTDLARLLEAHPEVWELFPEPLRVELDRTR